MTWLWGYDDGVTGRCIPADDQRAGGPTDLGEWTNGLPGEHLLPVDTELTHDGGDMPLTLTHLHGGVVPAARRRRPRPGPGYAFGETQHVSYPNSQPAARSGTTTTRSA